MDEIVKHFLGDEITIAKLDPLDGGLINDTYLVELSNSDRNRYVLQKKNSNIFKNVPLMVQNMSMVTNHLFEKVKKQGGNPEKEAIQLIPTLDNQFYYLNNNEYWILSKFIENTKTFESLAGELAFQGGKMIGKFQEMVSDLIPENTTYQNRESIMRDVLPGFHNIQFRFQQFDEALEKNLANRVKELSEEIGWVEKYRSEMMSFWQMVEENKFPMRITHNDTKLSNILFDSESNEACCLIDFDTLMCSSVLNDFGDAIRSYCNSSTEDESNIEKIYLRLDIFESFTSGYLSESFKFLTKIELDHLAFSAKYITFEQMMRFLTDYINGDTYYKINYGEHNLVRTRAQHQLLESIESNFAQMNQLVSQLLVNKSLQ